MFDSNFLPPVDIIVPFALLNLLRFENQRWIRAISQGRRGSSGPAMLFVNFTGFIGLLVIGGSIVFLLVSAGWQVAVSLFLLSAVATLVIGTLLSVVLRGDSFLLWVLATVGVWSVAA